MLSCRCQAEVDTLRRRRAGIARANRTASSMGIEIRILPVVETPPEALPTTMPTVNDTSSPEPFVPTTAARCVPLATPSGSNNSAETSPAASAVTVPSNNGVENNHALTSEFAANPDISNLNESPSFSCTLPSASKETREPSALTLEIVAESSPAVITIRSSLRETAVSTGSPPTSIAASPEATSAI